MREITPLELAALELLHGHLARTAQTPTGGVWSSWADEVIEGSDAPPPDWLCDLSLGETDRGMAGWLRPVVGVDHENGDGYAHLLFGVEYLRFKAGRLSLDELVGMTALEFIDSDSVGSPIDGGDEFRTIRDDYQPERTPGEQPPSWLAKLERFFEPHVKRVYHALNRLPVERRSVTGREKSAVPVIFECPTCHQAVTRPLVPLPGDVSVSYDDGQSAIPEGFFALSDDDYWTGSAGCPLINLADLAGTRHHPDSRRNGGCCGRDGCDGPNLLCGQGHEIGTEKSDCWMAHAAVLLSTVRRRPATG